MKYCEKRVASTFWNYLFYILYAFFPPSVLSVHSVPIVWNFFRSDYVLRRGLGVRGSHYFDGKKVGVQVPQSAPLSTHYYHSYYFLKVIKWLRLLRINHITTRVVRFIYSRFSEATLGVRFLL
jgi:hypothetical protein